jgi:hypothetical protein
MTPREPKTARGGHTFSMTERLAQMEEALALAHPETQAPAPPVRPSRRVEAGLATRPSAVSSVSPSVGPVDMAGLPPELLRGERVPVPVSPRRPFPMGPAYNPGSRTTVGQIAQIAREKEDAGARAPAAATLARRGHDLLHTSACPLRRSAVGPG